MAAEPGELSVTASHPPGATHVLDQLWRRLGLDGAVRATLAGRRLRPGTEQVLFTLVANRALADSSKLAAADWICGDVHQDTDLLNLEVDLLFLGHDQHVLRDRTGR